MDVVAQANVKSHFTIQFKPFIEKNGCREGEANSISFAAQR